MHSSTHLWWMYHLLTSKPVWRGWDHFAGQVHHHHPRWPTADEDEGRYSSQLAHAVELHSVVRVQTHSMGHQRRTLGETMMQVNTRSTQSLSPPPISKCKLALAHKIPIFAVVTLRFGGCSISSSQCPSCVAWHLPLPLWYSGVKRFHSAVPKVKVLAVWMHTEYPLLIG